jgi:hypothetical protein
MSACRCGGLRWPRTEPGPGSTSLATRSPRWLAKRRLQGHPCAYSALLLTSIQDPEGARRGLQPRPAGGEGQWSATTGRGCS